MKKIVLLLLFLIFSINISRSEVITNHNNSEIYKTIIFKNGEADANKILYEYIVNTSTKELLTMLKFSIKSVCAYKIDLNNDGNYEIIGYVISTAFEGWDGSDLFILRKQNNKYVNIASVQFHPFSNLYILKNKTNGYYDLKFYFARTPSPKFGYSYYEQDEYIYNYSKMGVKAQN